MRLEFAPMVLHRTLTGFAQDVSCIVWSKDSSVLVGGSKDGTLRVFTVDTTKDFEPCTLSAHKTPVVAVYLNETESSNNVLYSVSQDGVLASWTYGTADDIKEQRLQRKKRKAEQDDSFLDFFRSAPATSNKRGGKTLGHDLVGMVWGIKSRFYFKQQPAVLTAASFCKDLLVVGFSSGLFGLYELPLVSNIHTLSIGSGQAIRACSIHSSGDWLAFGCPTSQQLLVWEWRSETYVLQQRGHAYGMRCMAYSPDGMVVCTGGEDGKLKLWNSSSGFCYATMGESHTAPLTALAFCNSSVVLSASLDGTVRAHDLHRYRCFKTLTTPTPVQFLSLAVDNGDVVVAGTADPFHVYAWNLQSGKLLDVFTGHAGPVCSLALHGSTLASASWDGTVKLWNIYKQNSATESLTHGSDVVACAFSPTGKYLCSATLGGKLVFWNTGDGALMYEIDGRRDISGGRKVNDRMTAKNNVSSRYFTSVCYSADGACVLAGGNSKFVCIYAVESRVLVTKFCISHNRSLDGVLDELNSKHLGDGGPIGFVQDDDSDQEGPTALRLPGAKRGDDGSRSTRVEVLTHQVSFSNTGREWAAVSAEGLHVYSLDDDSLFDPTTALTENTTPSSVLADLAAKRYGRALLSALHLNETALLQRVVEDVPYPRIAHVVRILTHERSVARLMQCLATMLQESPHVEFCLQWCMELLRQHGRMAETYPRVRRACRAMYVAVAERASLVKHCEESKFALDFIQDQANLNCSTNANVET